MEQLKNNNDKDQHISVKYLSDETFDYFYELAHESIEDCFIQYYEYCCNNMYNFTSDMNVLRYDLLNERSRRNQLKDKERRADLTLVPEYKPVESFTEYNKIRIELAERAIKNA